MRLRPWANPREAWTDISLKRVVKSGSSKAKTKHYLLLQFLYVHKMLQIKTDRHLNKVPFLSGFAEFVAIAMRQSKFFSRVPTHQKRITK